MQSRYITQIGVIAAVYAAATLFCILFTGSLAWGPIQFRISEALCVLALFTPAAAPGLAVGCVVANLANMAISGTGMFGLLDVVFGSLASYIAARWIWHFRKNVPVALLGPVLANALIVSAYLPIILRGFGFYTIPFTSIDLEGSYGLMYLFGFITTGMGEAVILYVLGWPLFRALGRVDLFGHLSDGLTKEEAEV